MSPQNHVFKSLFSIWTRTCYMNSLFFPYKFSVQEMSLHPYTTVKEKDKNSALNWCHSMGTPLAFWMGLFLVGGIAIFITGFTNSISVEEPFLSNQINVLKLSMEVVVSLSLLPTPTCQLGTSVPSS